MANLEITLPAGQGYEDLQKSIPTTKVVDNADEVFSLVNMANRYLWFFLGVIATVVVIWAGFKLITAKGDEKEMKTVVQTLIGTGVGVLIAIFSYVLVRIVSNVF